MGLRADALTHKFRLWLKVVGGFCELEFRASDARASIFPGAF